MTSLFLLIVLTQNGAGDINAAFINTETLAQCEQKALMLDGVFQASKIPVIERRCITSDLQFSEFGHAASSSQIRNFYLIEFTETRVTINQTSDWEACMQQAKFSEEGVRRYCASSIQSIENG